MVAQKMFIGNNYDTANVPGENKDICLTDRHSNAYSNHDCCMH